MEAARQLLLTEGIERFTVSAVAALAEVSKPAVYYYFESKEELVGALSAETLRAEVEAVRRAVDEADDGIGALIGAVNAYVEYYASDLDRFRVLHVWTRDTGSTRRFETSDARASRQALRDELVRRLGEARSARILCSDVEPRRLVEVAMATAHGLVFAATTASPDEEWDARLLQQLCGEACRMLRRAVVAERQSE
jgi:AcrR family transcriptional regulator